MLQITATPKEFAELVMAIRDGEFGSDPAERYYSKEDARLEVSGEALYQAQEERDEAFALAAVHALTLDELSGKSTEELRELLENRAMHILRPLKERTTGELIAELKQRESCLAFKVDNAHPYSVVIGDDYKSDLGPATVLVINGK